MSERIEQFLEDGLDGSEVGDYQAAVDALVAAGLLAADGAEGWKAEHRRVHAAGGDFRGPYDPQVEDKAIELLEDLLVPARPSAGAGWDPAAFRRYSDALSTLTGIGALSLERAQLWLSRQAEMLAPPGGPPEPEPDPELPFLAAELSAVIAGPPDRAEGMRVMSLELYGDCVLLHFHFHVPEEPADPVEQRRILGTPFTLEDDAGTAYRSVALPTPGRCRPRRRKRWPELIVGWQAFVPGAPLRAREFVAGWRESGFKLLLEKPSVP